VSLDFSVTHSFRPFHGPGVDSVPSENEFKEHVLGVKAAGAWGWRPHHLHVLSVMEIWEPKPPGTLWASPGLLVGLFSLYLFLTFCRVGRMLATIIWTLESHRDESNFCFMCITFPVLSTDTTRLALSCRHSLFSVVTTVTSTLGVYTVLRFVISNKHIIFLERVT
jgi:hypothetical protein